MSTGLVNICQYKVKPGKEAEMEALLAKHWPALREAGLVDDTPPVIYKGEPAKDHGAERMYIEIFAWKEENGAQLAHQMPGVMAVWEPMGAICEHMDFPSYAPLELF